MRDEISNKQQIQTTKAYSHILSISGFTFPVPVFLYSYCILEISYLLYVLLPFKRNGHANDDMFQQNLLNFFLCKSNADIEYINFNHFMLLCLFNLMRTRYCIDIAVNTFIFQC